MVQISKLWTPSVPFYRYLTVINNLVIMIMFTLFQSFNVIQLTGHVQTMNGQLMQIQPLVFQKRSSQPLIQKRSDRAEASLHSLVDTLLSPISTARSRDGWRGYVFMDPLFKNPPLVPMFNEPASPLMPYQPSESAPVPYVVDPPTDMHMSSSNRYTSRSKHFPEPEDFEDEGLPPPPPPLPPRSPPQISSRKRIPSESSIKTTPKPAPAISIGHSPGGGTSIRLGKAQITFKKGSISLGPVEDNQPELTTLSISNKKVSSDYRLGSSSLTSAKSLSSPLSSLPSSSSSLNYDESTTNNRYNSHRQVRPKRPKTSTPSDLMTEDEDESHSEELENNSKPDHDNSDTNKDPIYKASASGYYHSYKPYQPGRTRGRIRNNRNYSPPPLYPDTSDDTDSSSRSSSQSLTSSSKSGRIKDSHKNNSKSNRSTGRSKSILLEDYDEDSTDPTSGKSKSKSDLEGDYDSQEYSSKHGKRKKNFSTQKSTLGDDDEGDDDDFYIKSVSQSPEVYHGNHQLSVTGKKREKKTTTKLQENGEEEENDFKSKVNIFKSDSNDYVGDDQNRRKRKAQQQSSFLSRHLPKEHRMIDDDKSSDVVFSVNRSNSKSKSVRNSSKGNLQNRKNKSNKQNVQIVTSSPLPDDEDEEEDESDTDEAKVETSSLSSFRSKKVPEKLSNHQSKPEKKVESVYFTSSLSEDDLIINDKSKKVTSEVFKKSPSKDDKIDVEDTVLTVKMPPTNDDMAAINMPNDGGGNIYQIRLTSRIAPIKVRGEDGKSIMGSEKVLTNGKTHVIINPITPQNGGNGDGEKKADEKVLKQLIQMMQDTLVDIKKTNQATTAKPCLPSASASSSSFSKSTSSANSNRKSDKKGSKSDDLTSGLTGKAKENRTKNTDASKKSDTIEKDLKISVLKPSMESNSMSDLMKMLVKGTRMKSGKSKSEVDIDLEKEEEEEKVDDKDSHRNRTKIGDFTMIIESEKSGEEMKKKSKKKNADLSEKLMDDIKSISGSGKKEEHKSLTSKKKVKEDEEDDDTDDSVNEKGKSSHSSVFLAPTKTDEDNLKLKNLTSNENKDEGEDVPIIVVLLPPEEEEEEKEEPSS